MKSQSVNNQNDAKTCEEGTNRFPPGDLSVAPDTWRIRVSSRSCGNEGGLGHEKRSGDAGALRVVGFGEFTVDMLFVCTEARQRRHHDAMLDVDGTDWEGAK